MRNTGSRERRPGAPGGQTAGRLSQVAMDAATSLIGARGEEAIIDVTMLGASSAGKTTLLTSIYERFDHVIGGTDLELSAVDEHTTATLQTYLGQLERMPHDLRVQPAIEGTRAIREYAFGVGQRGSTPKFTVRFTDYPGGYLTKPGGEGAAAVRERLDKADVVLVAIDTPALMEHDGIYHHDRNAPVTVLETIKRMLRQELDRLIILVPLKCESYVGSPSQTEILTTRLLHAYAPLLNYISVGAPLTRAGCVLTPVQTLGSVVFSRIEVDPDMGPVFLYHSRRPGARYEPADTDQPLRYALRFVINRYRGNRGAIGTGWARIIGTEKVLLRAVDDFAAGCKTDGGFRVIQSHRLLQPRSRR